MNAPTWVAVCRFEDLDVERGVAVLVHGRGVAVFRTLDGEVRAVSNRDPFSKAGVLARGLVGTREGVTFVASPAQLLAFDLATGVWLDDPWGADLHLRRARGGRDGRDRQPPAKLTPRQGGHQAALNPR